MGIDWHFEDEWNVRHWKFNKLSVSAAHLSAVVVVSVDLSRLQKYVVHFELEELEIQFRQRNPIYY